MTIPRLSSSLGAIVLLFSISSTRSVGQASSSAASIARCASSVPLAQETRQPQDDDALQAELVKSGASTVRFEPQFGSPVSITGALHGSEDLLKSANLLNMSNKTVTAIRLAWSIKTPSEPVETKKGDWVMLAEVLKPGEIAKISRQNIDPSPMRNAGTIITFYITEVRFQDGTKWERDATKSDRKMSQLVPLMLITPKLNRK